MKCFVASAFDHKDVDAIYDRCIRPVLKDMGIARYRVDRDDHNEDIDDRIFKMIDESDLCIADLTYARPSVYYEAGYAFGSGKPVIYIARRDHFKPKSEDPLGNFKVHFDLQMKNIIPWVEPNDEFRRKLRRRLTRVVAPLHAARDQEAQSKKDEEAFRATSQSNQVSDVFSESQTHLLRLGYKFQSRSNPGLKPMYIKKLHGRRKQIHLVVSPAVGGINGDFAELIAPRARDDDYRPGSAVDGLVLLVTLKRSSMDVLRGKFGSWTPMAEKLFVHHPLWAGGKPPSHSLAAAFVDGIVSLPTVGPRLAAVVKRWESTDVAKIGQD